MITLRRDQDRHHHQRRSQEVWSTFGTGDPADPLAGGFAVLEGLSEQRLAPGGVSASHPRRGAEIVSYVYRGTLAQEDSTGSSRVVQAGEFQLMTVGRGVRHKETNPSPSDWSRVFRISLHPPQEGLDCAHSEKRFSVAERRNVLRVVASPDGRRGSLRILQDAVVMSSVLEPGRHLTHELLPGRGAWLHVIDGDVTLQDVVLSRGDGAGVTADRSVSLTAVESTEILLVDLGRATREPSVGGAMP